MSIKVDRSSKIFGRFFSVIGCMFFYVWIVMLLWNAIIPGLIGLATIGYWKAFGIYILCGLLFKSKDLYNNQKYFSGE